MALVISSLDAGSSAAATPSTASVSWNAGDIVLFAPAMRTSGSETDINVMSGTVSGLTLTRAIERRYGVASANRVGGLFYGLAGSNGSGTIALAYSGPSSALGWSWIVAKATGANTGGTNGANAIGTIDTAINSDDGPMTGTIPGTPLTGDYSLSVDHTMDDTASVTGPSGWTNVNSVVGPETQTWMDYNAAQPSSFSYGFSTPPTGREWLTIGLYLRAAVAAGTPIAWMRA